MKSVKHNLFAPTARKITFGVIIISALVLVGNIAANAYFTPEKIAHRELEKIAKDYYENYFYDNYTANFSDSERNEKLAKISKNGFPHTMLRQLLLYDDGKHANSAPNFRYEGYTCDTNKTYVIYFPEEPYGKTDYRVEYHYDCK